MQTVFSSLGTWTLEQSTDAPDGFSNSIKMTCTTPDASPAASGIAYMRQIIEAQNLQHLKVGTPSAQPTTLSFYVKATKTGSFTLAARTFDGGTRMFSKNITVSSTNWEYKTVTIPGDTGGGIANDNGWGLEIGFWVNSGSTFSGGSEMSTWAAQQNTAKYLGTIDIGASTNDAIQFAGIQLELGSTATPFEHRSYGDELARCQRYYWQDISARYRVANLDGTANYPTIFLDFPVPMRAAPDGAFESYAAFFYNNGSAQANFTPTGGGEGTSFSNLGGTIRRTAVSGGPGAAHGQKMGQWSTKITLNAEL
jgi:hypothetical protein